MNDQWLKDRIVYIKGLKSPTAQQELLVMLAEKPEHTKDDERKMAALVRAEKAADRAIKARADAARILNAEKKAARKARDHQLYESAGLLILAGLVDTKTGLPVRDRGELVGALASLASATVDDAKRKEWKTRGDALIAAKAK